MQRFKYQVRDAHGEALNGVLAAPTIEQASQILRSDGKFVVKLTPISQAAAKAATKGATGKVNGRIKRSDVIFFVNSLAVMLDTGVPISEALNCVAEQASNPAFAAVLRDVTTQVQSGTEFSTALGKYPKVFPNLMTALVKASEVSGTMGTMLERISQYMTKEDQTLRQARGALMYPAFMGVMALSVTIFLLTVVLPRFAKIYEGKGAVLPGPTRFLIATSNLMVDYWYAWLIGTVVLVVGMSFFKRTTVGKRTFDWLKLHTPIIGNMFNKLYVTRATRTMGTMINAGVSMLDMVSIVKHVTNNVYYEDLWKRVEDKLNQGAQLSDPLFDSPLIPKPISQMIYSGERSGRLGQVMERIAGFTEIEFDTSVKTTTQFIEPLMIGVMGGIIGFVAIALLMPIFSVGKVMAGG